MENSQKESNHPASAGVSKRRSTRSRHKKGQTSTLSSRLHPDFNIKKWISQDPTTQDHTNAPGNLEINAKTLEFNNIIELLQPNILKDCLQRTLLFLQNDSKVISFRNISSQTETFLVKIASDNKYLLCDSFNDQCKTIASQLLDAVERNKHVYRWTHSYENGLIFTNVLVYKKIYFRDAEKNTDGAERITTTQITRTQDANNTQLKDKDISTGFKIQALNATLKFIKDNNRLSLEYPDMLMEQAKFVCSLIQQNNDGDIGFGFKSLYSPLIETLKEFNKMYDFDVLVGETSKDAFRVTIRKIPKRRSVPHDRIISMDISSQPCPESKTHNSSFNSDSTDISESSRHLSRSRKLVTKQKLLHSLPHIFIKSSLQAILNFMDDPLRASLEFNNIASNESRFLERVTTLAKQSDNHQYFAEDCVVLLKAINRSNRHNWYMDMIVGKLNKRTKLRNVSFHKVPVVGKGPDKQQVNTQSVPEKIVEVRNIPKPTCPVPDVTNKADSKERRVQGRTVSVQNVHKPQCPVGPEAPQQRAVSRDRRNRPIPAISFESAGLDNKTRQGVEPMDVDNKDTEVKLQCARKNKLLEAMSTPMESDIAERMMRMMGWDGGALGTRGDGIIEPIIPALHLSKGAGLGHMKQVTRSPHEFRTQLLKNLSLFLHSGESETVVSYNPPVTKKEESFVRTAVRGFNSRKVIGVNLEEEVKDMNKILEGMISDPLLLIECGISDDKRTIKILKNKTTSPRPTKKTKTKHSKSQSPETETSNRIKGLNASLELDKNCPSSKSAKALAYRIMFLESIKEFLQLPDSEKDYEFDCLLNKKQRSYVQVAVTSVNGRCSKCRLSGELESDLYRDILKVAGDYYLTVVFNNRKLTLQKKNYQKRFTNSALLPPPKSTDLQNTIIYTNNDASNYNQNVASDDDDVICIEEKREIIVISDSDSVKSQIITPKSDINEDCDISKDISNESLLLEMLEGESDLNSNNSMLDKDISELEAALLEADVSVDLNLKMEDDATEKLKKKDLNLKMEHQESGNEQEFLNKDLNLEDKIDDDEFINRDRNSNMEDSVPNDGDLNLKDKVKVKIENDQEEVNNNIDLLKDKNNSEFDPDFTINDLKCESRADDLSSVSNTSKRSRSTSDDFEQIFKITKGNRVKTVCVAPNNFPKENITRDTVEKFQLLISDFIDNSTYLPLLECHGVQNGGLIYSCHNENSLLWLKNLTSVAGLDVKIFDTNFSEQTNFIVQFKINSFIREDVDSVISRLELYNPGLDTSCWKVLNENIRTDSLVITVEIDDVSLKFISENDFSMFFGIDKARFSIVFE